MKCFFKQSFPFLLLLVFSTPAQLLAGFTWKSITSFGGGVRYDPAEFVIGNKGYVCTGLSTGVVYHDDLWEFDPSNNVWTQMANLPAAGRFGARAFAINNLGYLTTGWSPAQLNDLWEYDPVANSWIQKTNFAGPIRYTGISMTIGLKGYFGTGYSPLQDDFWEYDPAGNSWTQKANVPGGVRQSAIGFSINGLGYAGMGSNAPTFGTDFDDFYSYDPVTNLWTTLNNFPGNPRYGCESFVLCGKGYVGLGRNIGGTLYNDFYSFDPATGLWTYAGVFSGGSRWSGTSFAIANKGYIGLGSNGTFFSDMWEYSADADSISYAISPCGNTVSFTAVPGGSTSYYWDFGDSNTSIIQNPSHTYAISGTYDVLLVSTTDCVTDSFTLQVTVTPVNVAQAAYSYTIDSCSKTVSFSDSSTNAISWSWNFGDSTFSSSQNPVHQYAASGNYLATLIVYNACDTDSVQQSINIIPVSLANASFGFSTDTCTGVVSFNNLSLNATSYWWYFGDGDSSSQTNPSHQYIASGTYQVILAAIDTCGPDTTSLQVIVNISPQASAAFSFTLDTCDFEITFANQSLNSSSFLWDFGDSNTSNQGSPLHQYADSGNYVVTLISTNACGADTITQNIFIPGVPQAVAGFQVTVDTCTKTATFLNQSLSSASYFWSFGDGDSSLLSNPTHVYQDTGQYQVVLYAYNTCNTDSMVINIYVPYVAAPQSAFNFSVDTCNQTVSFNNQSLNGSSYNWNFGDLTTDTTNSPVHQYQQAGTYNVTLVVSGTCDNDTLIQSVDVPASNMPVSNFTYQIDSCLLTVTFSNNSQNIYQTNWNFGDGALDTAFNPQHLYADTGLYQVVLVSTNPCGADTLTLPLHLTHPQLPAASFSYTIDSCNGILSIVNNSSNANSYYWTFGNGTTSTAVTPVVNYADTGNYIVTLTAYGLCDSNTVVNNVYIPPVPPIEAEYSQLVDTCSNTIAFFNQSTNAVSYIWYFSDGDSSYETNPIHTFNLAGTYPVYLVAFNSAGCSDTFSITTEFPSDTFGSIFIPNCFTPNGDNHNETFKISRFNECPNYILEVYNRWGERIFYTEDLNVEWDGRFKSKNVPDGVYFYLFTGKNSSKKGTVSVFR